jgi:polyisoprenoid-binding protein YceI
MKKTAILVIGLLLIVYTTNAQKFLTKNGHVSFYSHTPMEDIRADNKQVGSIIDQSSGEVVITILMKSFKFDRALMEEHFNENYVESDKFPKASFKGKITNLAAIDFGKNGVYNTEITGQLTMHGVTGNVTAKGTIEVKDGKLIAKSKFLLPIKDYKIEIPSVVKEKIQDNMDITVDMEYSPMAK